MGNENSAEYTPQEEPLTPEEREELERRGLRNPTAAQIRELRRQGFGKEGPAKDSEASRKQKEYGNVPKGSTFSNKQSNGMKVNDPDDDVVCPNYYGHTIRPEAMTAGVSTTGAVAYTNDDNRGFPSNYYGHIPHRPEGAAVGGLKTGTAAYDSVQSNSGGGLFTLRNLGIAAGALVAAGAAAGYFSEADQESKKKKPSN